MTISIAIGFWFFYEQHINFDLTPTLSITALAATSADLVRFFVKHLKNKQS
jgi:hypothetical protein